MSDVAGPEYPKAPETFPTTTTPPNDVGDEGGLFKVYLALRHRNRSQKLMKNL
jgi:hypothetical protein